MRHMVSGILQLRADAAHVTVIGPLIAPTWTRMPRGGSLCSPKRADYLDVFHCCDGFEQDSFNTTAYHDDVALCILGRSAERWSYPDIRPDTGFTLVFRAADESEAAPEQEALFAAKFANVTAEQWGVALEKLQFNLRRPPQAALMREILRNIAPSISSSTRCSATVRSAAFRGRRWRLSVGVRRRLSLCLGVHASGLRLMDQPVGPWFPDSNLGHVSSVSSWARVIDACTLRDAGIPPGGCACTPRDSDCHMTTNRSGCAEESKLLEFKKICAERQRA